MKSTLFNSDGVFDESTLPIVLSAADKRFLDRVPQNQWAAMILATLAQVNFGGHVMANLSVTPTVDTSIYASGDVLFDTFAIPLAVRTSGASCQIKSVTLLDKDDNTAAGVDLFFLSANVSLGTVNAAPSITDANAAKIVGFISLVAGDFIDVGGSKVASKSGLNLEISPATGTTIWVAAITRGTPTQTAGGLILNLAVEQE
jgi:hypothetical protein